MLIAGAFRHRDRSLDMRSRDGGSHSGLARKCVMLYTQGEVGVSTYSTRDGRPPSTSRLLVDLLAVDGFHDEQSIFGSDKLSSNFLVRSFEDVRFVPRFEVGTLDEVMVVADDHQLSIRIGSIPDEHMGLRAIVVPFLGFVRVTILGDVRDHSFDFDDRPEVFAAMGCQPLDPEGSVVVFLIDFQRGLRGRSREVDANLRSILFLFLMVPGFLFQVALARAGSEYRDGEPDDGPSSQRKGLEGVEPTEWRYHATTPEQREDGTYRDAMRTTNQPNCKRPINEIQSPIVHATM